MPSLQALVLQQAPRDVVRFHSEVCTLSNVDRRVVLQREVGTIGRIRELAASSSRAALESFELVFVPSSIVLNGLRLTVAFAPESTEVGSVRDLYSLAGCHFPSVSRQGSEVPFVLRDNLAELGISSLVKPVPLELGRLIIFFHFDVADSEVADHDDDEVYVRVFARGRLRLSGFDSTE